MKILHCRDAGFNCDAVIEGNTSEEVLAEVRRHAKQAHDLDVDSKMAAELEELIRHE